MSTLVNCILVFSCSSYWYFKEATAFVYSYFSFLFNYFIWNSVLQINFFFQVLIKSKHSDKYKHKQEKFPILMPRSLISFYYEQFFIFSGTEHMICFNRCGIWLGLGCFIRLCFTIQSMWRCGNPLEERYLQSLNYTFHKWWLTIKAQPALRLCNAGTTLEIILFLPQNNYENCNCWWDQQGWPKVFTIILKCMCTVGWH